MTKLIKNVLQLLLITSVVVGNFVFLDVQHLIAAGPIVSTQPPAGQLWSYQCIDTMKYSRDSAREFMSKPEYANTFISNELRIVKSLGATCVSIATPYDEEFIPLLTKWVDVARTYGLGVWFRGNFAGWEGWFSYPKLKSTAEHNAKLTEFVTKHPDLFKDGDILSPAPEAENGLLGNPWRSKAASQQLRDFVVSSTQNCKAALAQIKKNIPCGYFSANGDVARDVYNHDVLEINGGLTVIDHYVSSSEKMGKDLDAYASKHQLPIMIGEFGAPIPDINGKMTEVQQADFIRQLLHQFYTHKNTIVGINYWVLRGGSTSLLNDDGSERLAANVVRDFLMPGIIVGRAVDGVGKPAKNISIRTGDGVIETKTDSNGNFTITAPAGIVQLFAEGGGYISTDMWTESVRGGKTTVKLLIHPTKQTLLYKLRAKLHL